MYNWHTGPWSGAGMIFMMILMVIFGLLFLVGIGLTVAWLFTRFGGPRHLANTPLDILKERYAKGEITREEYERIKQDIS